MPSNLRKVEAARYPAAKWQRLAYFQLVLAVLLGVFAGLAIAGLVGPPRGGGVGPLVLAVIDLGLAMRSLSKAHELSQSASDQ